MSQEQREKLKARYRGEGYTGEQQDIQNLIADAEIRPVPEQKPLLTTLERYEEEAGLDSYKADPTALIDLVRTQQLLKKSRVLVDLGAGPGDFLRRMQWDKTKNYMGVDLSPGFVRRYNAQQAWDRTQSIGLGEEPRRFNSAMWIGTIDSAAYMNRLLGEYPDLASDGSVISTLTLDRVPDPRQLIRNMKNFRDAKILATLLPVVAEDDNPSRQEAKVVYTLQEKRVTPGINREEDALVLRATLEREWEQPVETAQVPYVVESSGDRQEYMLDVFFTRPKK